MGTAVSKPPSLQPQQSARTSSQSPSVLQSLAGTAQSHVKHPVGSTAYPSGQVFGHGVATQVSVHSPSVQSACTFVGHDCGEQTTPSQLRCNGSVFGTANVGQSQHVVAASAQSLAKLHSRAPSSPLPGPMSLPAVGSFWQPSSERTKSKRIEALA
jgi:hypothetical protein